MWWKLVISQKSFAISDISDLEIFLLEFKEESNFTIENGYWCN
jgi:hypothetical protein